MSDPDDLTAVWLAVKADCFAEIDRLLAEVERKDKALRLFKIAARKLSWDSRWTSTSVELERIADEALTAASDLFEEPTK
jgi:hypothetical protein